MSYDYEADNKVNWILVLLSLSIVIGALVYLFHKDEACSKRRCPKGQRPYTHVYSTECVCVTDPK